MILVIISPVVAVAAVILFALILMVVNTKRKMRVWKEISKAENFDEIDQLRGRLSPVKYGDDLDEREKALILRYVARINEYTPEEIVRAYIRAHRQGFEEIKEKLRKIIITNLKIRLDYARQPKNAGPDLKKNLKQLQRLAQVINHKHYLEEIENLIETKEPA